MTGEIERRIVERARDGDGSARKQIYDSYSRYLAAVCARLLPDPVDQMDVLQDSFIKIFTSLDRFDFRGEGSLKAWMRQISVNESLKFLRNKRRTEVVSYESEIPEEAVEEETDVEGVPIEELQNMIKSLPGGYRAVFNLYAMEDKSHKEIAGLLGISESTSASQLHRARVVLAQKIREYRLKKKIEK